MEFDDRHALRIPVIAPGESKPPSDRSMEGGSVDELLDVIVQRPVLDELEVEVSRPLEDGVQPGLAGDDGEECHLHAVDRAGSHQRPRLARHDQPGQRKRTVNVARPKIFRPLDFAATMTTPVRVSGSKDLTRPLNSMSAPSLADTIAGADSRTA